MADKNVNSEQDNAYIATLLSKLRESLGQTDAAPGTSAPVVDSTPETTEPVASALTETSAPRDEESASPVPETETEPESVPESEAKSPRAEDTSAIPAAAEDTVDTVPAPAAEDTVDTVPAPAAENTTDTVPAPAAEDSAQDPVHPDKAEPSAPGDTAPRTETPAATAAPTVAVTVETEEAETAPETAKTAEEEKTTAHEVRPGSPAASMTPAAQASPDASDATGAGSTTPKVTETVTGDNGTAGAYARTVQPGDPRFSGRNTTGRFLDFRVEDTEEAPARAVPAPEASVSPLDSILDEPLFPHASGAGEAAPSTAPPVTGVADRTSPPEGETMRPADIRSFADIDDGTADMMMPPVAVAPGMPIPDRVADTEDSGDTDTDTSVSDATVPDASEPLSIWDTLPPLPRTVTEETSETVETPSPTEDLASGDAREEPTREGGLFGGRTRPTIADCTFETRTRENVVVDKILTASQDLLPEGAKEKQDALWRQELRHKRLINRIRVIAVGVLLLLSVAVELIPPFPRALLSRLLLTRVPGALHLIDLQILLLAALFGVPQLVRGCSALRSRRIIPETLLACGMFVSLIAGIVLTAVDLTGTYFCSLPAVMMMFASLMGDSFRLRALSRAFDSYAVKGHHFCAVFSDVHTHPLLGDEFRDARNPHLFETASASGIERFVSASRKRVECRRACWITFAISGGAALLSLILSLVTHGTAAEIVWAFTLTLTGVMPLTLFGAHRYLFAMLTFRVSEERVGIADEITVYDYAHTGVMTFEDTEAFPAGSVQLNGIKLCGDFRLDKALYLTASVFDTVGGPLNGVFRVSTSDINISDNVDIRALFENGIDARVNHDDVLIGTKAFLEARGVSVFRDVEDERAEQGRACVLYLAYMGTLSAKFHLNYRMSDAFESNVEYYAKHGVTSAILTADPLLNRAFLDRISYVSEYDVRIVKKTREALLTEDDGPREATLITYGPRKTLRRMPFFFGAYAKYQAIVIAVMMVMASLAAVYVPLLLCFMNGTVPWLSFVTQLVAGLPCVIFGFFVLRLNPNK